MFADLCRLAAPVGEDRDLACRAAAQPRGLPDVNPFPTLVPSDGTSDFASSPLRIPRDDTRFSRTYHLVLDTCLGYNFLHYTTPVRPTGRPHCHWPFS